MKCIAGVFLLAATSMAQALLAPVESQKTTVPVIAAKPVYQAMTGTERWRQFTHDNLTGPGATLRSMKTAAFEEITGRPIGWKTNGWGFSERFGSSFARNAVQGGITDGIAAMLGHDTRYLPCNCLGVGQRLKYSLKMTVFTRNRNGQPMLDVSRLAGAYGSAFIATTWQPSQNNLLATGARIGSLGVSTAVMTNIAREFTPELKRMAHRHNR